MEEALKGRNENLTYSPIPEGHIKEDITVRRNINKNLRLVE